MEIKFKEVWVMDDVKKIMGKRLLHLRAKLNLSQREFAKSLSTSAKTICSWENGKNYIPTKYLFDICKKHKVNWDFFDPLEQPKDFFTVIK
jgi:DNA-binding transcriptional regulator YiaG